MIVVAHELTAETWRNGQFHPPTQSYRFANLPSGSYSIRAEVAGYSPRISQVNLRSCSEHLELVLSRTRRDPLVLDAADRVRDYRALARDVYTSAESRARLGQNPNAGAPLGEMPVRLGACARILALLVSDDRVVRAVSTRGAGLQATPQSAGCGTGWRPLFWLFGVVLAVYSNAGVRDITRTPPVSVVEQHLLRVLGALDHPGLDTVGQLITRLYFPELVAVDFVSRSLTRTFSVAAPAGLGRRDAAVDPQHPAALDPTASYCEGI